MPFELHFEHDDMYGGLGANFWQFFLEKPAISTPFGKHFERFWSN